MNAIELSKNIIAYAAMNNCQVTNLKLQKTLYYVQGYFLARFGMPIFEEQIVNWAYGPVVPSAYFEFCTNGASAIAPEIVTSVFAGLTATQTDCVCKVVEKCLEHSARDLVEMTHSEDPWKNTLRNQIINVFTIKAFFENNDPLHIR